jgi:hypothetical protein
MQTLDPRSAAEESDTIVLAYPVSQRDVRGLFIARGDRPEPLRLAEMETTLKTLQVLKGQPLPSEIRFRYYDARGYAQVGPPQGPSGHLKSRGIFFLRRQADGSFRSVVDVYRPDIQTPWILGSAEPEACASVSDCIARLLLTYHESDDARAFSRSLLENVATARQLTGFFKTFDLLGDLAENAAHPDPVRHGACVELSKWYALERPSACSPLVAGTEAEKDFLATRAKLRDALRKGGLPWVEHRIGINNAGDVRRYVELLTKSTDDQTRALGRSLAEELH